MLTIKQWTISKRNHFLIEAFDILLVRSPLDRSTPALLDLHDPAFWKKEITNLLRNTITRTTNSARIARREKNYIIPVSKNSISNQSFSNELNASKRIVAIQLRPNLVLAKGKILNEKLLVKEKTQAEAILAKDKEQASKIGRITNFSLPPSLWFASLTSLVPDHWKQAN